MVATKGLQRHFFLAMGACALWHVHQDTKRAAHLWTFGPLASVEHLHLLLACMLSLISDYIVLGYHAATPPHPKFRLSTTRRAVLAVHIASGEGSVQ